jgi:hypothetical protein
VEKSNRKNTAEEGFADNEDLERSRETKSVNLWKEINNPQSAQLWSSNKDRAHLKKPNRATYLEIMNSKVGTSQKNRWP